MSPTGDFCHDIEWGVSGSLFTSLRFHGGTKGFALCGVLLPSTPLWSVLALLCAAALRYSSLMFQVPLWTSTKAREYPLWSLRALSPPVRCCLPAPCLLPLCGCPCVCVLFCPSLCCPSLLVPAAPGLRCFLCFLVPPCLFVVLLAFLCPLCGAPVCCPVLNLFLTFWVLLNYCGPWRLLLLPLVSGPFSVFVLLSVGVWFVGCLWVGPLSWVLWGCLFEEVGPARSHGLDCTAASFTGADQWSSLPCCPERPRAAKPAHMVRSVRIQRHCGDGTL